MRVLVVGRGLLGRAFCRQSGDAVTLQRPVPWADPRAASAALAEGIQEFTASAPAEWGVAWCAGAGVVGTDPALLALERHYLELVLRAVDGASALFVASSAGGLYGDGSCALHTERSAVSPRPGYGEHKRQQEEMAAEWASANGVPTLIGRISNLYGGDQDLSKRQGFISHICRAIVLRRNFVLSVPPDSQRDFLYSDDAAARIARWFSDTDGERGPVVKILGSGRPRTLSDVIRVAGAVSGIHPRVLMAENPSSRLQPRYLRFRSVVRTDLDAAIPARAIEVGLQSVWRQTLLAHANGRLT